jgi:ubiquinone/menaquinone biosynthesis C-methylase UbiE
MSDAETQRIQREKVFHDSAFSDDRRKSVKKYYGLLNQTAADFVQILTTQNLTNKNILEYGCGKGSHAFQLSQMGAIVTGIDISTTAIEQATAHAKSLQLSGIQFLEMNAENLKIQNNEIDLICGSGILHHLDLEKATSEIARVLKPGGEGLFIEPLENNPIIKLYRKLTPKMRTPDEHPLTNNDMKTLESKFKNVDMKFYYLTSLIMLPFTRMPGVRILVKYLNKLDQLIFKYIPASRMWAWQVIIQLKK